MSELDQPHIGRRIFEAALDAMLLADESGRYVDANPAACALFGLPRAQLIGRSIAEFAAPEYDGEAGYRKFQAEGQMRGLFPLQRPDGTRRVLEYSAVANLTPGLHLSVLRDVTERIEAEEKLRQSEARLRLMIDNSADGISLTGADGATVFRSPAVSRMLGFSPEELAERPPLDSALPEDRDDIRAQMGRLMAGERTVTLEYRAQHRDGSVRWIEAVGTNLLQDPDVAAMVGNFRDVTDRKRVEEQLQISEERYRHLIEDLPEPVFIHTDGKITFANSATVRALGAESREALIGKRLEELVVSETPLTTLGDEGYVQLSFARPAGGGEARIELRSRAIVFDGGPATLAVGRDVTERVRAAQEAAVALLSQQQSLRLQRMAGRTAKLGGWSLDLATNTVLWSDEVCAIHEVPPGYVPPLESAVDFYAPEHRAKVSEAVGACIRDGTPFDFELQLVTAKGRKLWVRSIGEAVRDASGKIVQLEGAFQDITDRREVESSLRASEALFRTVIQSSWDVFHLVAPDGTILYESPSVERVLGFRADEMIGRSVLEFMHPDDRPTEAQLAAIAEPPSGSNVRILRVRHKDGGWRWVESFEVDLRSHADVRAVAVNYRDITQRKEAEDRLAETNRALRLLSRAKEALIRSTEEDELLATICRITITEGGFRGASVGYAQDDSDRPFTVRAYSGGDAPATHEKMEAPDSPAARVLRSGAPVIVPDLSGEGVVGSWADAARSRGVRGLAALPLKQAEAIFGVLVLELGEVRDLRADQLQVRRELADTLALGTVSLRSQAERRRLQTALQKVAASSAASGGGPFFEQLAARMVEALDAPAGFVARLLPGFPARARTVAAIVDGRALPSFELALEGTPCQALLDLGGPRVVPRGSAMFTHVPPLASFGAKAFVGWRLDDDAGEPAGLLFVLFREPLGSTEFVSSTLQIFATRAALELERQKADARLREQASMLDASQDAITVRDLENRVTYWNKSAERHYGWTAAEAIGRSVLELMYAGDESLVATVTGATLEHGKWSGELTQRRKDGTSLVVEARTSLVRDDQGEPRAILSVKTDLTERKRLERTEEQLRQVQKMEAIGSLAGGVAHDFNNLLSVILSYAELALKDMSPSDPLRGDLEEVKRAGLRASELTGQLLAFGRKQIWQPVVLDLDQVLANIHKMLLRVLGEHIELEVVRSRTATRVFADAGQIEQVIMNLVVNARDAMPDGGHLTIETASVVLDEAYAAEHAGTRAGPHVMLAVSDTGTGMDEATQARVFEPFFTTKEKSKGTGLGLSTVYGIVQQTGGHITLHSEPGKGSTFKIYLPRSERSLASILPDTRPKGSLRGTETILIVEDEDQVRALLRLILRKNGYHVLEAQNGGEAFLISEQFEGTVDLMITDLIMPRMSGRHLAERLSQLRPEMKVLFISGYTEDTIIHHGIRDAGIEFLPKPVLPDALLAKVRALLDKPNDAT